MSERERNHGPWYARILSERGLGAVLAVVLVLAMLWFGVRIVSDLASYQATAIAESARTGEKLQQIQLNQLEMKIQLDRIERLLIAEMGKTP